MHLDFDDATQRLYSKLFVSCGDLSFARECAVYLLKNGWHYKPWEKRGGIYFRQSAFTTALIVAYARPFTQSRGWPKISKGLIAFARDERELHERMLLLRNQVYAHSDSAQYSIRPWSGGGLETDIVGAPFRSLEAKEVSALVDMIDKLLKALGRQLLELRSTAAGRVKSASVSNIPAQSQKEAAFSRRRR